MGDNMARDSKVGNKDNDLSRLRLAFFPIYDSELSQFIPMCGLVFFTIFAFHLLRSIKDPLITTAPGSSVEVLSFLKIYLVLPITILSSILYMRLRRSYGLYDAYNLIIGIFISFFFIFAVFIYPNAEYLHPSLEQLESWQNAYPSFKYPLVMVGLWTYCLFYVFSELWGTFALSILFWQIANDTTRSDQAKRFYPLYVMSGNLAMLALYPTLDHIAHNPVNDVQEASGLVVLSGMVLIGIFTYIHKNLLPTLLAKNAETDSKKKKLSFSGSIAVLMRSKYVGCIVLLVLSYGVVINLVELIWKSELNKLFPVRSDYLAFNRDYILMTGVATIFMNYISKGVIRKMSWITGAIITPISCGVCSLLFFIFVLNKDILSSFLVTLNIVPLAFTVWFGAYGVLISKGSKYSFFDPTKEMVFIPLDDDLRTNGKAAVDGIGGRLGKSAGGLLASTLFMVMGSPPALEIAPILSVVVFVLTIVWIMAVIRLSKLYNKKLQENMHQELDKREGTVSVSV